MVTVNFKGFTTAKASGVTQWDYGQVLKIDGSPVEIPDESEAHFYQGELSHIGYVRENQCTIPDVMLQNSGGIILYIYVRSKTAGETVLTAVIPIERRKRPENYVLPAYQEYKRLLPEGGEAGQVPVIQAGENGERSVVWGDRANNIKLIEGALQLMSGDKEIGERLRLPGGGGGSREIELRRGDDAIQWRYTDSNEWMDLIAISAITGPAGETPIFERRDDHLYVIYKN